jgi:hypothetical protein
MNDVLAMIDDYAVWFTFHLSWVPASLFSVHLFCRSLPSSIPSCVTLIAVDIPSKHCLHKLSSLQCLKRESLAVFH